MHVAHGKNMLEWPNGVLFAIGLMVCTAIYVILQVATIATPLQRMNRFGIPWISLILSLIVGLLFMYPAPSWYSMVGIITSATADLHHGRPEPAGVISIGPIAPAILVSRRQVNTGPMPSCSRMRASRKAKPSAPASARTH